MSESDPTIDVRFFQRAIEHSSDIAFIGLNEHGIVSAWNAGAQAIYDYASAEILGHHYSVLASEEERAAGAPQRQLLKARNSGRFEGECWRRRRDGSRLRAAVALDLVRDQDGRILGFACITRDLSERRAAEQVLVDTEQRFRMLVDGVVDYAIYILDPDGLVTNWNSGANRIKGYTAEEIIGRHFSAFYTEEDRAAGEPARSLELAATHGRFEAEGWRVRKDSSRFWASVVIDSIRAPDGRLLGFAKVTRDITERRQAHEALIESERQFRLFVQGVTDYAMYRLDTNGIVSSWNSGAQKIKGYTADEVIGQHFSKFYTAADRLAGVADRALETARKEGKFEAEGWRVRKDGTLFWAHVVIDRIYTEQGELLGFAKITRDVTDRRNAQKALEAAKERLAHAQRMEALGKLTGGVAHDFNNLLMVVSGQAQVIERAAADRPRAVQAAQAIRTASKRGVALTRQMLSFSRRQNLNPQKIDLRTSLQALSSVLAGSMPPTITISTHLPEDLWFVKADPAELELAVLNVVINARDAMPEGGTVTIKAANAELRGANTPADLQGKFVALTIADTGAGIPPDIIPRVFEPFFTTKSSEKGTGLGLSQVYGFTHQSGGTVTLDSVVGSGTQITFYLPSAESVEREPEAETNAEQRVAENGRVLVVEDNPDVAQVTALMLEELGYVSHIVSDAASALAAFDAGERFDIVFTDIVMPGSMDGLGLARTVRERYPTLPVLLASGYNNAATSALAGYPVLRKPYDLRELDAAIARALTTPAIRSADPKFVYFEDALRRKASKDRAE